MNYVLLSGMITKVAIPIWENRVSPVMDTASQLMLLEFDQSDSFSRQVLEIPALHMIHKIEFIRSTEINLLICGAISQAMFRMIAALGIEIIPFIRGNIDEVIKAYIHGQLHNDSFFLPGYPCGRGRNRQNRRRLRGQGRKFNNRMRKR